MNTIIKTLISIALLTLFISCEVEDYNQPSPGLNYIPESKTFVMPDILIGEYKDRYGEVNKGAVSISENTFVIESDMFIITVTLNNKNALAEGCYLYITIVDGRTIKITDWLSKGKDYIYIVLLDNGVEYELGLFNKVEIKN